MRAFTDEPFEGLGKIGGGEEQVEIPSLGPLNYPRDNYGPHVLEEAIEKTSISLRRPAADKARMERLKEIASNDKAKISIKITGCRENQEKVATREHFDTVNADEIQQEQTNFNEVANAAPKNGRRYIKKN